MLFVEKHTLYVFICHLVDKTTSSFVYALRELVVFVRARSPEAFPIELHGDSDRAWAVTGRGDDTLPDELDIAFKELEGQGGALGLVGLPGRAPQHVRPSPPPRPKARCAGRRSRGVSASRK